jgi:hypothetical protein
MQRLRNSKGSAQHFRSSVLLLGWSIRRGTEQDRRDPRSQVAVGSVRLKLAMSIIRGGLKWGLQTAIFFGGYAYPAPRYPLCPFQRWFHIGGLKLNSCARTERRKPASGQLANQHSALIRRQPSGADTSVNAGRPGRTYPRPQHFGSTSRWATTPAGPDATMRCHARSPVLRQMQAFHSTANARPHCRFELFAPPQQFRSRHCCRVQRNLHFSSGPLKKSCPKNAGIRDGYFPTKAGFFRIADQPPAERLWPARAHSDPIGQQTVEPGDVCTNMAAMVWRFRFGSAIYSTGRTVWRDRGVCRLATAKGC